ncbi:MAG: SDR family oxidoreductase [Rhodocyclaceae bacterium]|jgi:NAD(P)-dependent dehydrogenase (short-subunit alcohol dehydrogenase family)|nr:SDR family oxidoreductase [Rhodocyclaceae bacterium]MBK9311463.1 SDR family oxidoreductase [Rhodocyclaceae bacterium]
MKPLQGKSVIITGGGGGIGRPTARMLAVAGARVIVSDVREDAARMTRDYVVENGGEAIAVPADITREEDVRELVAAAVAAFGGVDVLVNNGGGSLARDVDIVTMDVGVWDAIMALNARGPMLCCKYAIPEMLKRGRGAIVNISSGAALSGQLGIPAYSAAKAAVIALTRSIATLHGQQGIRCNAITPGLIMHERLAEIFPAEQVRVDAENILTPSPGTPEDIGATVVFLASEQARFINAQVLPVDGGLLAHTPTYAQTRAMVSKRLEVKERS